MMLTRSSLAPRCCPPPYTTFPALAHSPLCNVRLTGLCFQLAYCRLRFGKHGPSLPNKGEKNPAAA